MAKKQEFRAGNPRHGDPVVINIPPKHIEDTEDDGTVKLTDSGLAHIRALKSEAAIAKARGEKDLATGLRRDLEPYAITNTVARSFAVYVDSVPLGETTIIGGAPVVGDVNPSHYLPSQLAAELDVSERTIAKYAGLANLPPRPAGRGKAKYSREERIAVLRAFCEHSSGTEKATAEKILRSENQS